METKTGTTGQLTQAAERNLRPSTHVPTAQAVQRRGLNYKPTAGLVSNANGPLVFKR